MIIPLLHRRYFSLEVALLFYLGLMLLAAAMEYAGRWHAARLRFRFTRSLERELNAGLAKVKWSYLVETKIQDAAHLVTAGPIQLSALTQTGLNFISGLIIIFVYGALSLLVSAPLTLLAMGLALFPVAMGIRNQAFRLERTIFLKNRLKQRHLLKFTDGMKLAKSYNLVESYLDQFERQTEDSLLAQQSVVHYRARFQFLFKISGAIIIATVLYTALERFQLPLPNIIVLLILFSQVMIRVSQLEESYLKLVSLIPVYHGIRERISEYLEHDARTIPGDRVPLTQEIRFENVTYCHGAKETLKGLSCTIPARRVTAVVGKSGAGKTTFADLLLGLLSPTKGQIMIDSRPLSAQMIYGWHSSVSYVPQEPYFFHDTIRANFAWVKPDVTDLQVWSALESVCADRLVRKLPRGLDTIVGDKAIRLSGGERQWLMLARALLRSPDVLLLDEPTSSLDSVHEESIQLALENLRGKITIVVIAHRLSTLRLADQVLVLDEGNLIEVGNPMELLKAESSSFRFLFTHQIAGLA